MCMKIVQAVAAALVLVVAPASGSEPVLKVRVVGTAGPAAPNDIITVAVSMAQLGEHEAAGFQAFLQFNTLDLQFQQAHYTAVPFGLPVISPIAVVGPEIDMASGINMFSGQTPTSADSTLALMHFKVLQRTCRITGVQFREHNPPSRLTDGKGATIEPLTLDGLPLQTCLADVMVDGVVQVSDLLYVINQWGPCAAGQPCCADIIPNGVVDVSDLLAVINQWGPCP